MSQNRVDVYTRPSMDIFNKIKFRLQASRIMAGHISSYAFSKRYGVPKSTYSQHESGSRIPRESALKKYSDCLNVNFHWLKTGYGHPFALTHDERNAKIQKIFEELLLQANWKPADDTHDIDTILLTEILHAIFVYDKENKLLLNNLEISHSTTFLYQNLCGTIEHLKQMQEIVMSAVKKYFTFSEHFIRCSDTPVPHRR